MVSYTSLLGRTKLLIICVKKKFLALVCLLNTTVWTFKSLVFFLIRPIPFLNNKKFNSIEKYPIAINIYLQVIINSAFPKMYLHTLLAQDSFSIILEKIMATHIPQCSH